MKARALYICYFGLREPLVQTQVLPYLREIIRSDVLLSLLTFEPSLKQAWSQEEIQSQRESLRSEGIEWYALPYHKRPTLPATVFDIVRGAWFIIRHARRDKIRILHARGHVPATMAALAKVVTGADLIFDIRGFMPEEYTDAGIWPEGGYLFRITKFVESLLYASSDAFVVLTEKARLILFGDGSPTELMSRPLEVIPCCIEPERFRKTDLMSRDQLRRELNIADRHVLVYVGALGGWYLIDQMADFIAVAHRYHPLNYSFILSQSNPELIISRLLDRGISERDFVVCQVPPSEVPRYLKAADLALSFIKPCYSKKSSSPTKIAEYLAGGLPIICNAGVGDVDEVIKSDRVGCLIDEFTEGSYLQALETVDGLRREGDLRERCRSSAYNRFDLEKVGGARYRRLYHQLLRKNSN